MMSIQRAPASAAAGVPLYDVKVVLTPARVDYGGGEQRLRLFEVLKTGGASRAAAEPQKVGGRGFGGEVDRFNFLPDLALLYLESPSPPALLFSFPLGPGYIAVEYERFSQVGDGSFQDDWAHQEPRRDLLYSTEQSTWPRRSI